MGNTTDNSQVAIQLSGVKKMYKLGQIGGGTLQGDLQSWWAKVRGKEDPNTKIGEEQRLYGQTFMALNGIDLTVYKGEALGIIGGNGAGKSTMLKLLSRVTAPTEGEIDLYGRITSMLEVGTGFNGEMTGRENVYLNGAILGMTKAEIDAKMEDIIEFSEVRDFIDTPVKRYSSGMYVKLAFSVAAHLDSEIMIMDEVLAVGDMAFQKKCLDKMHNAAKEEGRTVLYVSHNMNTIRRLCDRCIVLEKGKIIFQGDVEEAIQIYLGSKLTSDNNIDLSQVEREREWRNSPVKICSFQCVNSSNAQFDIGSFMIGKLELSSNRDIDNLYLRIVIKTDEGVPVTMTITDKCYVVKKEKRNILEFSIDISHLAPGRYTISPVIFQVDEFGNDINLDVLREIYLFRIVETEGLNNNMRWQSNYWGHLISSHINLLSCEYI